MAATLTQELTIRVNISPTNTRLGLTIAGRKIVKILCEINFGESRSSKIAIFAILGALNFVNLVNFSL